MKEVREAIKDMKDASKKWVMQVKDVWEAAERYDRCNEEMLLINGTERCNWKMEQIYATDRYVRDD
jgi:hypothetical protein